MHINRLWSTSLSLVMRVVNELTGSAVQESGDGGDVSSHHMAMFGAVGSSVIFTKTEPMDKSQTALEDNPETLFDPCVSQDISQGEKTFDTGVSQDNS